MTNEVIERSFSVSGKASLKLSNISGSIVLRSGQENQILVKATKLEKTGNMDRTEIVMEQAEDGQVNVATRFPEGFLGFLNNSSPCDVDYEVDVPRDCQLHVSGVSSSISVQDLSGKFELSTVSGPLSMKTLKGSVSAASVSGDLDGQEIDAPLHLKNVSGNINLQGSFSGVEASTVSGNINLQTADLGQGPYHFKTVSGDVNMQLGQEASFRLEHNSLSGAIFTNLPVSHTSKVPGKKHVEIGSGGPLISASSISGNLRVSGPDGEVRRVEVSAARETPPEPPVPPASSKPNGKNSVSRQEILDKISTGELSVEDALKELNSQ